MTMLSNVEIHEAIESGEISITPFLRENVQPASIVTATSELMHASSSIGLDQRRRALLPSISYDISIVGLPHRPAGAGMAGKAYGREGRTAAAAPLMASPIRSHRMD